MAVPDGVESVEIEESILEWRGRLEEVAAEHGYRLVLLFCEEGGGRRAFSAMVDALRRGEAAAVLVPDISHLDAQRDEVGIGVRSAARYLRTPVLAAGSARRRLALVQ